MFMSLLYFLSVVLAIYVAYKLFRLFRRNASIFYRGEDERYYFFADCFFKLGIDGFIFHDYNQPVHNRFQGHSNVDDGVAKINLRDDPSTTAVNNELHYAGYVTLDGTIFDNQGNEIGYVTDLKGEKGISGSGRWYELWLVKHSLVYTIYDEDPVGKISETGRLLKLKPGHFSLTARAAAWLLLYQGSDPQPRSEDTMDARTTWKDTALPATVVYCVIYGLMLLVGAGRFAFPALGTRIGFTLAFILAYFLIWAVLRHIKIEAMLDGRQFDEFLMLINRNTGLAPLNKIIILLASVSVFISIYFYGADFLPLQLAILIGMSVNSRNITGEPWEVCLKQGENRSPVWNDTDDAGEGDTDQDDPDSAVVRNYNWTLDSPYASLQGNMSLSFIPAEIEVLRANNPFRLTPSNGHIRNVADVIDRCVDKRKIHKILRHIFDKATKAGLDEQDTMQFILDFVQSPNITYIKDCDCQEIGNPHDYARYPDETLFDGRGDCDCKAVLAALLFHEGGWPTAYVTTQNHAAVAVAFKDGDSDGMLSLADSSLVTHDGHIYFFCETTGDGFRIGNLGDTYKDQLESVLYLD